MDDAIEKALNDLKEKIKVVNNSADILTDDEFYIHETDIKTLIIKIKNFNDKSYFDYKRNLAIIDTANAILKFAKLERKLRND